MIEVHQLTKRFGPTVAVDAISFTVQTGKTLALLGTSGSGKTTTLRMINRLIEPTSGTVKVNGEAADARPPEALRRAMGYVIQSTGLFPHYTVAQNIGVVPSLLGWEPDRIRRRTIQLLAQLGMPPDEFLDKYPAELSGGQQQRVGIARALAADPPIVLMDEPFGALDPITRAEIRADFMELEELLSKTVILVTHDVEEAFEMADLICLLDAGRIQQLDTPRNLLYRPSNAFVEDFLRSKKPQLARMTVCLADLATRLPIHTAGQEPAVSLSPQTNVRQAMQSMEMADGRGRFVHKGTEYRFSLGQLNQCFFEHMQAH